MKKPRFKRLENPDLLRYEDLSRRLGVRKFIAESCELAKTLSPRKRILFLLHFDHGYTKKEIAELCECDEATVTRRLGKISDELNDKRKLLSEKDIENPGTV